MGIQESELSDLTAQVDPITPVASAASRVLLAETDEADGWGVSPNFADTRENLRTHGVNLDLSIQNPAK